MTHYWIILAWGKIQFLLVSKQSVVSKLRKFIIFLLSMSKLNSEQFQNFTLAGLILWICLSYTILSNLFYLCKFQERIIRTGRWVALTGLTLHSTLLIHTVRFCMFGSLPFLHVRKFVLKDEDTYFASSFHTLMEDYMPCTTKRKGTIQCILTAPSSIRNSCWLSLMLVGS